MHIPFPERIPIRAAYACGLVLLIGQVLEGTGLLFSLLCFTFVMLSTLAFNICGGLTRPSGAYIFFFSTLSALVGIIVKLFLGEAADSHLQLPLLTMSLYTAGIAMMLLIAYINVRLRSKEPFLLRSRATLDYRLASVGCLVAGTAIPIVSYAILRGPETLLSPVARASAQLNAFLALAIILGVTDTIRRSGGRRSVGIVTILASAVMIFEGGVMAYSKQAFFTPLVCWLATAASLRFRIRPGTLAGVTVTSFILFSYMVPYSQYGRAFRDPDATFAHNFQVSLNLLTRLPEVKSIYSNTQQEEYSDWNGNYYSRPLGLLDRLEMISMDAALIKVTEDQGESGPTAFVLYLENTVPHVLWKNKPTTNFANIYGQEVGALAPEDETTNVSFSPVAESYRLLKWTGVLVVLPITLFGLFIIFDSLCGDLRRSPWGILPLVSFAHIAPEGGIAGPIYFMTYGVLALLVAFYMSNYVMPHIGALFVPITRPKHS